MQGLPSFVRMSAFTCVPFLPVPRLPLGRLAVQGEPLFFKGTWKECFVRLSFFFSFKGRAFISLSLSVCFFVQPKRAPAAGKRCKSKWGVLDLFLEDPGRWEAKKGSSTYQKEPRNPSKHNLYTCRLEPVFFRSRASCSTDWARRALHGWLVPDR